MRQKISFLFPANLLSFLFAIILVALIYPAYILTQEKKKLNDYSTETYNSDWEKVSQEESKGLPKSALKKVISIYEKAKKENNPSQIVKSLLHRVKFQSQMEEEEIVKAISELEAEVKTNSFPAKPVLHSILAEAYWQYYQNNQYKFLNRTATEGFKQDDLRTWDLKKIVENSSKNYQLSLENSTQLSTVDLKLYDPILNQGYRSKEYRPTLYDFLAHRAIDFFLNTQSRLPIPKEQFQLDFTNTNKKSRNSKEFIYLLEISEFINRKIETKDKESFLYQGITILQNLLKFRWEVANQNKTAQSIEALIDADLKRLNFVYQNSYIPEKEKLYLAALEKLAENYKGFEAVTRIKYYIASYFSNRAGKYQPLFSDENKWDHRTAYEICENAIQMFPNSDGAQDCKQLQSTIQHKSLSITSEKINIPNKPFAVHLNFKNVSKIYFRIYKQSDTDIAEIQKKYNELYKKGEYRDYLPLLIDHFRSKKEIEKFSYSLPNDKDYQSHSADVKFPALPIGNYVYLASTDENISYQKNATIADFFQNSYLTYINRTVGKFNQYYILNRETGVPIQNAKVELWEQSYNSQKGTYDTTSMGILHTDKNGFFEIPVTHEKYRNYYILVSQDEDILELASDYRWNPYNNQYKALFSQSPYYNDYDSSSDKTNHIFLFTDRAIYRPGQTVYFKGIYISKSLRTSEILPKEKLEIILKNPNGEVVSKSTFTTNDFGTIQGTFTLPTGGLNGMYSIHSVYGSKYFSVEDYKRPKFEVTIDNVKGTYKLKDTVPVKGKATSYSGAPIDNAKIKYRVVRKAVFPYWWRYYYWGQFPSSPEKEILNGDGTTNEKGEFQIEFEAIPDESLAMSMRPHFEYSVSIDVTDINGETHTAQKLVPIGYTALQLTLNIDNTVQKEKALNWKIESQNLSGEFEPTKVQLQIFKIKTPSTPFRSRKWERADKFVHDAKEWKEAFPFDAYQDEDNISKWAKENIVFNSEIDTSQNKKIEPKDFTNWESGFYMAEAIAKDKYGEEVKEVRYFTLFSTTAEKLPFAQFDFFLPIEMSGEPGSNAEFAFNTNFKSKVLFEIEHNQKITHTEWISTENLGSEIKKLTLPIREIHRGNFGFHLLFVKENRLYNHSENIYVPYTNKQLFIEYETFRNKLTPGQEEEWKIKIKGKDGEKVAAEMLASMYDASLDAFAANSFNLDLYNHFYVSKYWRSDYGFNNTSGRIHANDWNEYVSGSSRSYDSLNWFGLYFYNNYRQRMYKKSKRHMLERKNSNRDEGVPKLDEVVEAEMVSESPSAVRMAPAAPTSSRSTDSKEDAKPGSQAVKPEEVATKKEEPVQIRSNFSETAFFFPTLETDSEGSIIFKFKIPDSLTKWKFLGLAHTKDLKIGNTQNTTVTQKDLMVVPNAPRFFREGDSLYFTTKINNLSEEDLKGNIHLQLFDATNMKPISTEFGVNDKPQEFQSQKGQSGVVDWMLKIPAGISAVTYRIVAKSGSFSDGEEMSIPILTNRMLVTESLPLSIRGKQSKTYELKKLLDSPTPAKMNEGTLRHHKLTLEFTNNPAWYAVQAIPYLMEYPYECLEQTFSRYYANSLSTHIVNSNPKIQKIFDLWKQVPDSEKGALASNLEKNQELKSLLLEEIPWVREAKDESERKKRIALLFDMNRMSDELGRALNKILQLQLYEGGWSWFQGMPPDRYITQHIITGMGHLDHLGVKQVRKDSRTWNMTQKAIGYLDRQIVLDYEEIKKNVAKKYTTWEENHLGYLQIHYLYSRSYFTDIPIPESSKQSFEYFLGQSKKYWTNYNRYLQAMIALGLHRFGDKKTPSEIIASFKEHALESDEMGMYWKQDYGYYWYQLPIETHSLMIEVFDEVAKDKKSVDALKVWLLKNKQTTDWKTTKATSEAIYALLLSGENWLDNEEMVDIKLGDLKIDPKVMPDVKIEPGTGYFKKSFDANEIQPSMGKVSLTKKSSGVSWGGLYWQYFENLDKITAHETPLKLNKKLFLLKNTDKGQVLTPIENQNVKLKLGDVVKVRIELRVDREMEYVHMKDMRASAFEPENVFSQYKYQDGLHYYESTRDAATNFFFGYLPKGTYVFEYPLRVSQRGNFSNGITTIQSMYAPEFTSHSEGIRVTIE